MKYQHWSYQELMYVGLKFEHRYCEPLVTLCLCCSCDTVSVVFGKIKNNITKTDILNSRYHTCQVLGKSKSEIARATLSL